MNITSMLVGITIMGIAAPQIAQMSLQPFIAQKTAQNFGVAEAAAVTFAAQYEGGEEEPTAAGICIPTDLDNRSWQVTCTEGDGRFIAKVTRAFRLMTEGTEDSGQSDNYSDKARPYWLTTPKNHSSTECPETDQWGTKRTNRQNHETFGNDAWGRGFACIPQAAWNPERYFASHPDNWIYDINNWEGWGPHPDY
ncbi:MAG: hypothetical protein AB8E87_14755 [Prochlorococcus sp.]